MFPLAFDTSRRLGAIVRAERERRGWSQTEFAARAGVTRQWLVLLESGRLANPTLANVFKTVSALGLELHVARHDDSVELDLDGLLSTR